MEEVKLSHLEPGMLFKFQDTYAIKSKYHTDEGDCDCTIVGNGEMFWGGIRDLNSLEVEPIDLEYLITIEKSYGQLISENADLIHFKSVATKYLTEEQLRAIEDEMENIPDLNY